MDEDIIISTYLDGELPADVAALVRSRAERDPAFRARIDSMAALRGRIAADPGLTPETVEAMRIRTWQRLQRNLSPRPSRLPAWLHALAEFFGGRVSVPVPAMIAGALVVGLLATVSVAQLSGPSATSAVAEAQAASSVPLAAELAMPASFAAAPSGAAASADGQDKLALTIEVQNLRQLLSVLEESQGLHQVTIQLPGNQGLAKYGEPTIEPVAMPAAGSK